VSLDHRDTRRDDWQRPRSRAHSPTLTPNRSRWNERHILDAQAEPSHYLLCAQRTISVGKPDESGHRPVEMRFFPENPMRGHGARSWWYRCLEYAEIVTESVLANESSPPSNG